MPSMIEILRQPPGSVTSVWAGLDMTCSTLVLPLLMELWYNQVLRKTLVGQYVCKWVKPSSGCFPAAIKKGVKTFVPLL